MPRPLIFSKEYLRDLLEGRKTGTIRLGSARYKVGDVVLVYCGGFILGKARITSVTHKRVVDLTEEDALRDGFDSYGDLIRALKQHYPNLKPDTPLTALTFEWVEKADQLRTDTEYSWRYDKSPAEVASLAIANLKLEPEELKVLRTFLECGSIRAAARKLGALSRRALIRAVLRDAAEKLVRKGLVNYIDKL